MEYSSDSKRAQIERKITRFTSTQQEYMLKWTKDKDKIIMLI